MPHVDTPQTACRAGVSQRDITPPVGIYHRMWGAATHDRSTGIHKPLRASTLALAPREPVDVVSADAPTPQVLITLDHCLLWVREMADLRSAIATAAGLAVEQIQVTFTHTHGAGLIGKERASLPGGELIGPYLETLTKRVAESVREALANLRPATIVYGSGRCALAQHRDFWDEATNQYVCGFNPGGPVDDTVLVGRISDEQGRTVATLVNYACHPTTLAWENTLISPDYVGAMREVIEPATGAPCQFLQGASGDIGPREGFVGDPRIADRNGRELGYAALAALEALPPPGTRYEYQGPVVSGATLGVWKHVPIDADAQRRARRFRIHAWKESLAYRPDMPTLVGTEAALTKWQAEEAAAQAAGDALRARDAHAQVERMRRQKVRLNELPPGKDFPLPTMLWQLGDAFWLLVEAEHYNLLQRALRAKFPNHPIVIATLTNGWQPSYLPTAETYGKGIYQESIALVAPGSLEKLIESIVAKITEQLGER
jgi:hypothetical protein